MAPPADAIDWTGRPQNVAFTAFQWGEGKKTLTYTHRAGMVVRGVLSEWHPARGFPSLDVDEMLAATAR